MQLRHVWGQMVRRCYDETHPKYPIYGALGRRVCNQWRESFEVWAADMGPRPPGQSIERIDNAGDYEPGNCEWATPKEQARNMSTNRLITAFGVSLPLSEWAERAEMHKNTLRERLERGMDPEKALTERPQRQHKVTAIEKVLILKMHATGNSQSAISRVIGRPQPVIGRWLKRWAGITTS